MEDKKDIKKRLNRIKGQIDGLVRMVDSGRKCTDVLTQIKAMRAALNAVAEELVRNEAECCVQSDETPEQQSQNLQELVKSLIAIE
jgi:DNA-binding FrmR family transcriptional regulator